MKRLKIELGYIDDVDIDGLVLLIPWTIALETRRVIGWWRFFVIV